MLVVLLIAPSQKFPKCGSAVAVAGFFFWSKFGESFFDLGKIEHGVVAESAGTLEVIEDAALGCAAEGRKRSTIAGGGYDTDEAAAALLRRNAFEFAKDAGIVGIVVELIAFRPLGRKQLHITPLITTIAVAESFTQTLPVSSRRRSTENAWPRSPSPTSTMRWLSTR